jgi:two-component system, sensor histidine kinase LadS
MGKLAVVFIINTFFSFSGLAITPIVLTDSTQENCVSRKLVEYMEDTSGMLSIESVQHSPFFKTSTVPDLVNTNTHSVYWLRFLVSNQSTKPFLVEMFDFDIDEVALFVLDASGKYTQRSAGFSSPFHDRKIAHKNLIFHLNTTPNEAHWVYMRFKSSRYNVLEPMIRSYDRTLYYGFTEYLMFGVFYGLLLLMIFYNLLYFILLRTIHYLYYVLFATGILLYLVAQNGIGFQYLWPNYPILNPYMGGIGLYIGTSAMLFFAISFLELKQKNPVLMRVILVAFLVRSVFFLFQVTSPNTNHWELLDLTLLQIALVVGILVFKSGHKPARWYIVAYLLLDIAFVITWLEHNMWIESNICTVYALNVGIVLQFAFLSIGIGESVQEAYRQKNEAQANLIIEYKKNDELKQKINQELEQKVKERTKILELQNEEIQKQKEEIRTINENLEGLVQKRTSQLQDRNNRIREYAFSNAHLVRGPMARILGLTYLAKSAPDSLEKVIPLIDDNAKDLDNVIKGMTRILEETD